MWGQLSPGVLDEYVPATVIDEVLAATGRVQQRIRRLPARVTPRPTAPPPAAPTV